MDVRVQFQQADYILRMRKIEKLLIWGAPFVLMFLDYIIRQCVNGDFTYIKDRWEIIGLVSVMLICFFINYELSVFIHSELNWLKMLGLSNLSIFIIAVNRFRYYYVFFLILFTILNVFLVDVPVALLFLLEISMFWYSFSFFYFIKVWHGFRVAVSNGALWAKRIMLFCSIPILFLLILFQGKMNHVLELEDVTGFIYNMSYETYSLIGRLVLSVVIFVTFIFYFWYILKYPLCEGEEKGKTARFLLLKGDKRDRFLAFRGKRMVQLLKLNYILYLKNKNCFFNRAFFSGVWILLVCYSNNYYICWYGGLFFISMLASLSIYRLRDEVNNFALYETLGCTVMEVFRGQCITGFVYFYFYVILGILIACCKGGLSIGHAMFMLVWMIYQTIYFVSFNLYFIALRKISADSQLFELFECFVGTAIGLMPISILFPILFFIGVKKNKAF